MNISGLGELSWKSDVFGVLGEFRSEFRSFSAPLAQSVEHRTFNPLVEGSSPSGRTFMYELKTSHPKHLRVVVGLIVFQAIVSIVAGLWKALFMRDDFTLALSLISVVLGVVHLSNAKALNVGNHRAHLVMMIAVALHAVSAAAGLAEGDWIGIPQIAVSAYIVAVLLAPETRKFCAKKVVAQLQL